MGRRGITGNQHQERDHGKQSAGGAELQRQCGDSETDAGKGQVARVETGQQHSKLSQRVVAVEWFGHGIEQAAVKDADYRVAGSVRGKEQEDGLSLVDERANEATFATPDQVETEAEKRHVCGNVCVEPGGIRLVIHAAWPVAGCHDHEHQARGEA